MGKVLVNGISTVTLIDNGAQMSVTPSFVRAWNLLVGSISEWKELIQGWILILGAGAM